MPDVDLLVLNTVNASLRCSIDAGNLSGCLCGKKDPTAWPKHLRLFFQDAPRKALYRFVLTHRIDPQALLDCYRSLFAADERPQGDLDAWLAELADAA